MHADNFITDVSFPGFLTYNSELQTERILPCFVRGKAGVSSSITLGERVDEQGVHPSLPDQHLVPAVREHGFAVQEPRQLWSWQPTHLGDRKTASHKCPAGTDRLGNSEPGFFTNAS